MLSCRWHNSLNHAGTWTWWGSYLRPFSRLLFLYSSLEVLIESNILSIYFKMCDFCRLTKVLLIYQQIKPDDNYQVCFIVHSGSFCVCAVNCIYFRHVRKIIGLTWAYFIAGVHSLTIVSRTNKILLQILIHQINYYYFY